MSRVIHGGHGTRLYNIWHEMKCRTTHWNLDADAFNYLAKGIVVCDEWQKFEPFRDWAEANGYSDLLCLDRKDNAKGYNPDNCRWVTINQQNQNRRKTSTLTSSKYKGVSYGVYIPDSSWID